MTDLPLPAYVPLPEPDGYFKNGSAAFWAEPNMHAYAAAKTAELQAKVTRYEESTRLAEAHITLTLAQLAEAQAECASEKANNDAMVDCCDALDKKLRNAEAECARLRASRDAYKHDEEALLKIVETLHQKEAK